MNLWIYAAFGAACFIVGLSKGGLGGVLGFLVTPMLSLVMPPGQAVGLMLPVLILADLVTLAAYWRCWDVSRIWVLLAGGVVGVSLATLVLSSFPVSWMRKGLGVLVFAYVLYRLFEKRLLSRGEYHNRPWHGLLAGGTAGFASTLSHAGGPPITVYLLLQRLDPSVFIATSALFFAILNWIKVPYYAAAGLFNWQWQLRLLWLTPLAVLGGGVGKNLAFRLDRVLFERVVIGLLLVSGILLLTR